MGWVYGLICLFDFIITPVVFGFLTSPDKIIEWTPLTLKGAGLFHIAMMAILGATAWGRSLEKIKQIEATISNALPTAPPSPPQEPKL